MDEFEKAMSVHQFDYVGYCGHKKRMVRWTLDCENCVKKSLASPDMNFTHMIDFEREYFGRDHARERALNEMSEGERKKIFTIIYPGCSFERQKTEEVEVEGKKVRRTTDETETAPTELTRTMVFTGKKQVSHGKSYHCRKCGTELSPVIFKADCQTICHNCGAEVTRPRVKRNYLKRILRFFGLLK